MKMTLDEWIAKYNSKTKEPFARDERYNFFFLPEKGFCEVGMTDNMYIINQLCGDARFWKGKVDDMARETDVKMCGTWCIRPEILAYIRLFGYKVLYQDILEDGAVKYTCIHRESGKKGWASPNYRYKDNNQQTYLITWVP